MENTVVNLETSASTAALDEALAKCQGEIEVADKDKVNPAFKSRYADLASMWNAARAALSKNGISVTQWPLASTDNRLHIITRVAHKGEWMQARFAIPVDKGNAHGFGSAITYIKKFTLSAALGIVADEPDDDGNAAAEAHKPGVPGMASGGTDFRPATRRMVNDTVRAFAGQSSANGRRMANDNAHLVDNRQKGTTKPPAEGNGNAIKRAEWVKKAIENFRTAQTQDELIEWWKAENERIQVIEAAMPAEFERLIAAYDSAIERTARA